MDFFSTQYYLKLYHYHLFYLISLILKLRERSLSKMLFINEAFVPKYLIRGIN